MMHTLKSMDVNAVRAVKAGMQFTADDLQAAEADFQKRYPAYQTTAKLDDLRRSEYKRLDDQAQVYLDYTGGGLYAQSQLQRHMDLLASGVYGNPHSANPTSMASTHLDEQARSYIFEYFNANRDEYAVIFTPNASGALKLVGESYPFERNGQYLLTFDNHNSVNGIREFAHRANVPVNYAPVLPPDLRIDEAALMAHLDKAIPGGHNLFAYPAQSNFSGVQHSLKWIEIAQSKGWDVLLDAAAFAPTNGLDLSQYKPDFVTLSFYKIFGYPTGIGALIARRSTLKKLRRPWFAGGTITVASVQADAYYLHEGEAGFEDGTINYLNLPAVEIGLQHIKNTGIDIIHDRVVSLTGYLLDELTALRHDNGRELVRVYGPITTESRGGTISLNLYDPDNVLFDYRNVEGLANEVNISLRTGCFCNPGAGELALHLNKDVIIDCFNSTDRMTFEEFVVALTNAGDGEGVGAVRVSVGLASNFEDVYRFVCFVRTFLNRKSSGSLD
jgi:molybdenum cofactor sulfurtransferase